MQRLLSVSWKEKEVRRVGRDQIQWWKEWNWKGQGKIINILNHCILDLMAVVYVIGTIRLCRIYAPKLKCQPRPIRWYLYTPIINKRNKYICLFRHLAWESSLWTGVVWTDGGNLGLCVRSANESRDRWPSSLRLRALHLHRSFRMMDRSEQSPVQMLNQAFAADGLIDCVMHAYSSTTATSAWPRPTNC